MKYIVTIKSNFNTVELESNSRDSKRHLRANGGYECIVKNKSGDVVSAAGYNEEFGYHNILVD